MTEANEEVNEGEILNIENMQVESEIVDVGASGSLTGQEATDMLERLDEYCATANNDELSRNFARFRMALTKHIVLEFAVGGRKVSMSTFMLLSNFTFGFILHSLICSH